MNINVISNNKRGFSLIELIISLAIISLMTIGIYSLIMISIKLNADNAYFIEATEIANQKMEQIRNLSYDDVGVTTGFPVGVIPQDETLVRSGTYNVHTSVIYYDDPYDGEAGSGDLVFADYKIVTIKISWNGKFSAKDISIFSKIIPATEETTTGYGLLKVSVVDSNGSPVPNPDINIINASSSINMTITADLEGKLSVPLPPGFEAFEVIVSKTNYGTDKTYERNATNLNPTKPFLSIFDGLKTEESFTIDKLSLLSIKTLTNTLPVNFAINNTSSSTSNSSITSDSDSSGNTYIAWQNSSLATSTIFVQKINSSYSTQWSDNKKISSTDFQKTPDITTTSNGDSFVVWTDNSSILKAISYKPKKYASAKKIELNSNFSTEEKLNNTNLLSYYDIPTLSKPNKQKTFSLKNLFLKKASAASGDVTLVAVDPGNDSTGRYITLNTPSGVIENDLLIAYIQFDDASDGPIIPPSGEGWNILDNDLNPSGSYSDSGGGVYWKFASASESSSHTFYLSKNKNEAKAGSIRAYRGVNQSTPFDGSFSKTSTSHNEQYHSAPSKNVSNDGSMLVCGWGGDTYTLGNVSGGPNFPPGMSNTTNNFRSSITAASADMSVDTSDSPTGLMTFDARKNVTHATINWCLVVQPEIIPDDVLVASINNQTTELVSPSTNQYIGGTFVFTANSSSKKITGITIAEKGSINASSDMGNIKLFYDLDTSSPYDCVSEQYDAGTDTQFGSNTNFNAPDGKATFTDLSGVEINTTKSLCVYPVVDILNSANKDDIVEIEIEDPSTEILIDSGLVAPSTSIELNNSTSIIKPATLNQIHYRFREDDQDEDQATWIADQDIDVASTIGKDIRLRFEISNVGDLTSSSTRYQIEYGDKISNCSSVASWNTLSTDSSEDWQVTSSSWFSNGATTTNIFNGLSDENSIFKEGYLQDSSVITTGITLSKDNFTEIEFNILATTNASDSDYCFRLTNNGSTSNFSYDQYPTISIVGDNNIYILGIDNSGNNLWAIKKVNSDSGSADQKNPKIASTEGFGTATTVIAWEDNRDGNYNIYANAINSNRAKLWSNDLQVTASSSDENSIDLLFSSSTEFIVAWVDNSGGNNEIYLNKYDLESNQVWVSDKNITQTSNDEYSPKIIIDSSDNIYVAYYENYLGVLNSKLKKLDPNGNELWVKDVNISSNSYNQFDPSITINGTELFLSWTDQREGNNDIFSQKFDFSGNYLWANDQRLNVNIGTNDQIGSVLTRNSLSKVISLWQDNRDGEFNVYGAEIIEPQSNVPAPNVPLTVSGTKQIGNNPVIYEYNNKNVWTDALGEIDLVLEWDPGYSININPASSSLDIIKRDPIQPLEILADSIKTMFIYVE